MQLTGTLVADGSSDSLLKPILEWLLGQHMPIDSTIDIQVPEWGRLPSTEPINKLPQKLLAAKSFFPADVYFIHRDAERDASWEERSEEIDTAFHRVFPGYSNYVRVIPVHMTETWLLHNEPAIRRAAENPSGREPITLPNVQRLEDLGNAKLTLLGIIRDASGLTGRRRKQFEANERRRLHRLAELQQEQGFAILRCLPAFQMLENEIVNLISELYND